MRLDNMPEPRPPILEHKAHGAPSIFTAENLLREARRQKAVSEGRIPAICVLDPDGDIAEYLVSTEQATLHPHWACYHTRLYAFTQDGVELGIVPYAVGVVGFSDAITKLLGMSQEQIYTEHQAGKTLADIAKEKGITDQQLIDALTAGQQQVIEQAVKDGRLTQEQADWMLARRQAMAPFMLDNPFTPGQGRGGFGAGGHGPMMRGGMRGWAPQQAPVAPTAPGTGS